MRLLARRGSSSGGDDDGDSQQRYTSLLPPPHLLSRKIPPPSSSACTSLRLTVIMFCHTRTTHITFAQAGVLYYRDDMKEVQIITLSFYTCSRAPFYAFMYTYLFRHFFGQNLISSLCVCSVLFQETCICVE